MNIICIKCCQLLRKEKYITVSHRSCIFPVLYNPEIGNNSTFWLAKNFATPLFCHMNKILTTFGNVFWGRVSACRGRQAGRATGRPRAGGRTKGDLD